MKADFSRGFRIESPDGMTDTTKIYDSNGEPVSYVSNFKLELDSESSLPKISVTFHPGLETIRERTEQACREDPELAAKLGLPVK